MVIVLTPYSKFCTDTAGFDYPVRFGYDWFCCALDKISEAKANGQVDLRDFDRFLEDLEESKELDLSRKQALIYDLRFVFNK